MDAPGIMSVVPILVTLCVAVWTRNVIIGLFTGVFAAILILRGLDPITGVHGLIKDYFMVQILNPSNAGTLILMTLIGGLVALMERSGGAAAFAAKITRVLVTRTQGQVATWMSGLAVFFTDTGSPLIVGPIFQSVADKLRFSRQKLAYILDSTASPISVLIPVIGWGVYSMSLIQSAYAELGIATSEWTALLSAIPFQYYAILSLLFVPMIAATGFEFGPMAKAESEARAGRASETAEHAVSSQAQELIGGFVDSAARPILIWLPLLVMVGLLCWQLVPLGFPLSQLPGGAFRTGLSTAYFFSAITLIALMVGTGVKNMKDSMEIYLGGMSRMFSIMVILVLAWSLGAIGRDLGTAQYITALADGAFAAGYVPVIAFVVGAIISFATGSSWGTYAIMMPLMLTMADGLGAPMSVTIAGVLSGGLFGDHCSPISDTTILSSVGANCEQLDHVTTQLPYAMFNGAVSIVAFLMAGFTENMLVLLIAIALQIVSLVVLIKWRGVKLEAYRLSEA